MSRRLNIPALLIVVLPLFAIVASGGTAVIAMRDGDPTLPDEYHWEGDKLDHDFARSEQAARLDLDLRLRLQPIAGICHATLHLASAQPSQFTVMLIHGAHPELDRSISFARSSGTDYVAPCVSPTPVAQWHVEVSDRTHSWSYRDDVAGDLSDVVLRTGTKGTP
jgi:hypothetical protein